MAILSNVMGTGASASHAVSVVGEFVEVAASGSTEGTATSLNWDAVNFVTSGSGGVVLPLELSAGDTVQVINGLDDGLTVYAPGSFLDGRGTFVLAPGEACTFTSLGNDDFSVSGGASPLGQGGVVFASQFGAYPSNTDNTSQLQAAIDYLASLVGGSSGGGILQFGSGTYRCTGTLNVNDNFIWLRGAGEQATILQFANGSSNGLVFDGLTTTIRDVGFSDMSVYGSSKTAGSSVSFRNVYRGFAQTASFEGVGGEAVYVKGGCNNIILEDLTGILSGTATHGVRIECLGDGTERIDVVVMNNVAMSGTYAQKMFYINGWVNTIISDGCSGLKGTHCLHVANTSGSGTYYPTFGLWTNFSFEGAATNAILFDGGTTHSFVNGDAVNAYGTSGQGNADGDAIRVNPDLSGSITRSITFDNVRTGICKESALYINARDCANGAISCRSASAATSNAFPAVRVGPDAIGVSFGTIDGETFGGLARCSYALQIDNGATSISSGYVNGADCVSGAVNNLAAAGQYIPASIEPGGTPSRWTSEGQVNTFYNMTNAGNTVTVGVRNRSNANSSSARLQLATGLANSSLLSEINNNSGTPSYEQSVGSAVSAMNRTAPIHRFRFTGGVSQFAVGELLPSYADDAAAAAGGIQVGGWYYNTTATREAQRRV